MTNPHTAGWSRDDWDRYLEGLAQEAEEARALEAARARFEGRVFGERRARRVRRAPDPEARIDHDLDRSCERIRRRLLAGR